MRENRTILQRTQAHSFNYFVARPIYFLIHHRTDVLFPHEPSHY